MAGLFRAAKRWFCAISGNSACVAAILLAVSILAAPVVQAQTPSADYCLIKRDVAHAGKIVTEHSVVSCADVAGVGADWIVVTRNMSFAAASAARDAANAIDAPAVWCVVKRNVMLAGKMIAEQSVVRCDNLAGIGADWAVVSRDLTFAAASAERDALIAANAPPVWCLLQRTVMRDGKPVAEHSVVRCDNLAGAGAGWIVLGRDLTFAVASAERDSLNAAVLAALPATPAASPIADWCVVRRDSVPAGTSTQVSDFSAVRCWQAAGLGASWTVVERNLTFAAASTSRDARNMAAGPAVWCLIRRDSTVDGRPRVENSVVRCDSTIEYGAGWVVVQRDQTFAAASAARDAANATAGGPPPGLTINQLSADCNARFPGSVSGNRNSDGSTPCLCRDPASPSGFRVVFDGKVALGTSCDIDPRIAAAAQCTRTLAGSVPGARNANGSYDCVCPTGQIGVGSQCVNEQSYADTQCNNKTPGSRSIGRNPDNTYTCACPSGQGISGGQCVSEVADAAAQCSRIMPGSVPGQRNPNGGYQCACPAGTISQGNQCVSQQAEYTDAAAQCSRILAGSVPGQRSASGSYTCVCPAGAVQAGNQCVSQQAEYNNAAAQCGGILAGSVPGQRNANGSYSCVCPAGLVSTGTQCVNQVAEQANAAAQCARILAGSVLGSRNANGSYNCVCPAGLVSNGAQCIRQVVQQPPPVNPPPARPATPPQAANPGGGIQDKPLQHIWRAAGDQLGPVIWIPRGNYSGFISSGVYDCQSVRTGSSCGAVTLSLNGDTVAGQHTWAANPKYPCTYQGKLVGSPVKSAFAGKQQCKTGGLIDYPISISR